MKKGNGEVQAMDQERSVHSINGKPSNLYLMLEEAQAKRNLFSCEAAFLNGLPNDSSFYDCPCWRVTAEMSATDTLPDHVGLQAMAQSCQTWAQKNYMGGVGPYVLYVGDAMRAKLEHIEVGGGPGGGVTDFATDWPVPLLGSPVQMQMVVRQRIELADTSQRTKRKAIVSGHPQWENAVRQIARETAARPSIRNAVATQGRVTWQELPLGVLKGTATRVLASYSLPTTPSVVGCALELAIPHSPYRREFLNLQAGGPAPGLLVETLFLLDGSLETPHGDVHSSISGGSFEGNTDLWEEAVKVVARHRRWWKERVSLTESTLLGQNEGRPVEAMTPIADIERRYIAGVVTKQQAIAEHVELCRDQHQHLYGSRPASSEMTTARNTIRKRLRRADAKINRT